MPATQFRESVESAGGIGGRKSVRYYVLMGTRRQNEAKFTSWKDLPDGCRRYWLDVEGHHGWRARYLKDVDSHENTIRFWQEIYDEKGALVEMHQKFPVDEGHKKV